MLWAITLEVHINRACADPHPLYRMWRHQFVRSSTTSSSYKLPKNLFPPKCSLVNAQQKDKKSDCETLKCTVGNNWGKDSLPFLTGNIIVSSTQVTFDISVKLDECPESEAERQKR